MVRLMNVTITHTPTSDKLKFWFNVKQGSTFQMWFESVSWGKEKIKRTQKYKVTHRQLQM